MILSEGVKLEEEINAAVFLGVKMIRVEFTGQLEMKQVGLVDRIIETLALDTEADKGKRNSDEAKFLVKYEYGNPAQEDFSLSSLVGMML